MEKTISEVHSLLIEFEKSIKRNKQPIIGASSKPQVMAIQGGRVQKYKPQGKAKGKGKGKGPQNSYPTKPKKPQSYKKERPAKDGQCHHCKEEGQWKRNCPAYLAELMKKKKNWRSTDMVVVMSRWILALSKMALNNAQTKTNSSAFRSMLEKHHLTGPIFNEWFRALKLVVRTEKLQDVFETALPPAPVAGADAQALIDWAVLFYRHNEVACLMLGTMSPKLYQ
nr:hypothetical protein [Tanacetum cinerariifolium]